MPSGDGRGVGRPDVVGFVRNPAGEGGEAVDDAAHATKLNKATFEQRPDFQYVRRARRVALTGKLHRYREVDFFIQVAVILIRELVADRRRNRRSVVYCNDFPGMLSAATS